MGGNGSYDPEYDGVPEERRTHTDTQRRICGHKVLLFTGNEKHQKTPMNSNSTAPTYLIAKITDDGALQVTTIAVYEKNKIAKTIDLEFTKNGDIVPYSNGKGTHMHYWKEDENGNLGRTRHDKGNTFAPEKGYEVLIRKIVDFNKSNKQE